MRLLKVHLQQPQQRYVNLAQQLRLLTVHNCSRAIAMSMQYSKLLLTLTAACQPFANTLCPYPMHIKTASGLLQLVAEFDRLGMFALHMHHVDTRCI